MCSAQLKGQSIKLRSFSCKANSMLALAARMLLLFSWKTKLRVDNGTHSVAAMDNGARSLATKIIDNATPV